MSDVGHCCFPGSSRQILSKPHNSRPEFPIAPCAPGRLYPFSFCRNLKLISRDYRWTPAGKADRIWMTARVRSFGMVILRLSESSRSSTWVLMLRRSSV